MNAATKLALAILALVVLGLALVCYGAGVTHTKTGAIVSGLAITWAALSLFASIWRARQ